MIRRPATLSAVLLLAGTAFLAGCSGGSGSGTASSSSARDTDAGAVGAGAEKSGTPQTVDCPGKATAVDLPANFPAPLPAGTVVVAVQKRDDVTTIVTGVVPAAEADVLKDLQKKFSDASLTLTKGEREERDAESNFTGSGVEGRWGIRELSDCSPVATRIDMVVRVS